MQRPETRYARCGDIAVAYQVVGDGPIDLLYAQGWLSNVEYAWESPEYARFLTRLSRFARLIMFDKRGTGMSDRDVDFPTLEQRTEDIKTVLDAVGSAQTAILGISEGGNMASFFAATHPERVTALILHGCFARAAWAPDYPWGQTEQEHERSLAAMHRGWGQAFNLHEAAPSVAGDVRIQTWFAAYLRYSASPRTADLLKRLNFAIDIRDILPAIQAPTLVLHRQGDRWAKVEEARYLADRIPRAQLCLLPGEDHLAWYGDQDRLLGEIEEFLTGAKKPATATRALVTVLMTDIVDSTRALSAMGDDRWRMMLEHLDDSVDRRLSSFGGQKVKHTGDGYLIAFTGPTPAIECARALTRDAKALGLGLRTGIHTGECERRGEDLNGLAVHLAARIMAEATPGAIFVSRTVRDLAVGSAVRFVHAGTRELKGIPDSWDIYSVSD